MLRLLRLLVSLAAIGAAVFCFYQAYILFDDVYASEQEKLSAVGAGVPDPVPLDTFRRDNDVHTGGEVHVIGQINSRYTADLDTAPPRKMFVLFGQRDAVNADRARAVVLVPEAKAINFASEMMASGITNGEMGMVFRLNGRLVDDGSLRELASGTLVEAGLRLSPNFMVIEPWPVDRATAMRPEGPMAFAQAAGFAGGGLLALLVGLILLVAKGKTAPPAKAKEAPKTVPKAAPKPARPKRQILTMGLILLGFGAMGGTMYLRPELGALVLVYFGGALILFGLLSIFLSPWRRKAAQAAEIAPQEYDRAAVTSSRRVAETTSEADGAAESEPAPEPVAPQRPSADVAEEEAAELEVDPAPAPVSEPVPQPTPEPLAPTRRSTGVDHLIPPSQRPAENPDDAPSKLEVEQPAPAPPQMPTPEVTEPQAPEPPTEQAPPPAPQAEDAAPARPVRQAATPRPPSDPEARDAVLSKLSALTQGGKPDPTVPPREASRPRPPAPGKSSMGGLLSQRRQQLRTDAAQDAPEDPAPEPEEDNSVKPNTPLRRP